MQHIIEKQKKEIVNHRSISGTTIHNGPALIFGLLLVAMGFYILAIAFGWISVKRGSIKAPLWVIKACGIVFGAPGLFLCFHGISGMWRQHKNKLMAKFHPNQPWRYDYPWNPEGIYGRGKMNIFSGISFIIFVTIFLSPYYWFFQQAKGKTRYMLMFFAVFGAAIILIGVITTLRSIIQYFKYGRSFLRFSHFPFYLGENVAGSLECTSGIGNIKELSITLRCIHEYFETRGSDDDKSDKVISYSVYSDQILIQNPLKHSAGDIIPIEFALPADGTSNNLLERPARYWEIFLVAKTAGMGVGFESTYILPVYQRL